jgi:predicted glycosyltransferase
LIDIGHPAHVHFYKNAVSDLRARGHKVKITAREKDIALKLLEAYDLEYVNLGLHQKSMASKSLGMVRRDYKLLEIAKEFKADVLTGIHNMYAAHVGSLMNKPSVIFTDTEHGSVNNKLTFPFATVICTPESFKKNLGAKQLVYKGYHELAYLHPKYFKPNPSVLEPLDLNKDDKFIVLRFVSWEASHDVKQKGLTSDEKESFIKQLERYGRVLITSEGGFEKKFEKYKIKLKPEKIHDLLYYAELYFGEGGTMGSEAGLVGTPSVHVSTTAKHCGVFEELRDKFGLIYIYDDGKSGMKKAVELLESNAKLAWREKRAKMLNQTIDVNEFIVNTIEKYGED